MSDLAIVTDASDPNFGDLDISNGEIYLVTGKQAILQNIIQRLRTFYGEWFLDNEVGLPYYQEVLVKNPDQSKIDALFINKILGTPGVTQLSTYSFSPNTTTRILSISFKCDTTDGIVNYSGSLIV